MPETIFCLDYDVTSSIDENYKLTGNYLEKLTADLTAENLFENIAYLDKTGHWSKFSLGSVEPFYFANRKCFVIKIDQVYERNHFQFSPNSQILKLNFSKALVQNRIIHFMTKTKGKMEFSISISLDFTYNRFRKSYRVSQESFVIKQRDKFNWLKRPFSLFRNKVDVNDAGVYLKNLLPNYKETCKSVTLNLMLGPKLFDHEICDDLFDQLYQQIQNVSDWSAPSNLNYERQFVTNHLRSLSQSKGFSYNQHFSFGFFWFKKLVIATNHTNYSKFVLSLLNALSIWLGLGLLDLHISLSKTRCFFVFSYELFVKLKERLYRAL